MAILAPSTSVPGASRLKAKRSESQFTPDSRPMLKCDAKYFSARARSMDLAPNLLDQGINNG